MELPVDDVVCVHVVDGEEDLVDNGGCFSFVEDAELANAFV